jgi:cytochrome c-type biogenesis protein
VLPPLASISADPLGFLIAFGAGILSFLSPCVLPLVPGYVSMVSGLSVTQLERTPASLAPVGAGSPAPSDTSGPAPEAVTPALRPLLRGIALFVLGFTVVFVALGAAASGLGHLLGSHRQVLTTAAGAVVVGLGAVLLIGALPGAVWERLGPRTSGRLSRVLIERRIAVRPSLLGNWAAPIMGMAFAFAWTPCIGPVLAAVLGLAATKSSLAGGVVLLVAYSLGLAVPFLVTGLAFGRLTSLYARARRGLWVVHLAAGAVLVAFGALLLAGQLGWLSSQFSDLLNNLGLHRLTTS